MNNIPLFHAHRYSQLCLKLAGLGAMLYAFCLPLSLAAENTSFYIMLIFLILSGDWQTKFQLIKRNPIAWFAAALTLLYLTGTLYSNASWKTGLWIFKKQAEVCFIALLIPLFFENARLKLLSYRAFVAGAIAAFIIGALNMLGIFDLASVFHKLPETPAFPVFFHIYGGIFLAFASFVAAQLSLQDRRFRWVYILCWAVISFDVLFMSMARTGYVLFFMLMLLFLLQNCSFKQIIGGSVGIVLLFAAAYSFSSQFHFKVNQDIEGVLTFHSGSSYYSNSSGVRLDYAVKSYQLWKEKPIFGYGTGGFAAAYVTVGGISAGGASLSTMQNPQVSPENTFYFIAVEHGVFGLFILLALLYTQWKGSFKLSDILDRHIAQGLVISFVLASFSAPMLLDESPRLFFVFFSSLVFAALSKKPS
ncbi:MAG: O-antigen ligase [Gammaproteobacteria bacterium]|jgi:O-antigen ligase|nr:O-antigen ligase [Gammaproteobacteria bacterium]